MRWTMHIALLIASVKMWPWAEVIDICASNFEIGRMSGSSRGCQRIHGCFRIPFSVVEDDGSNWYSWWI